MSRLTISKWEVWAPCHTPFWIFHIFGNPFVAPFWIFTTFRDWLTGL